MLQTDFFDRIGIRGPIVSRCVRAFLFIAMLAAFVVGCGGGSGGGGGDPADPFVGSWSGSMDQTRGQTVQLGLTLQFQKGDSRSAVTGTLVETVSQTEGAVTEEVVLRIGSFTGIVTGDAMTIDGVLHYDANDVPDPSSSIAFHADLTADRSRGGGAHLAGTWSQGSHGGTLTVAQLSNSSTPNLNAAGTWIGDSSNQGGFTPLLPANSPTVDFSMSFAQDNLNNLTAMSIHTAALGVNPFTAYLGGTTGSAVNIQGVLPPETPDIGPYHIAGLPFTFSATVGPADKITGSLWIKLFTNVKVATFVAYRQTPSSDTAHIIVADRSNSRIVALQDMSGSVLTSFGSSGSGNNQFFHPNDVTTDAQKRIYVADYDNSRIVRFDNMTGLNWKVYNLGGGLGAKPFKVHVGQDGRIYFSTATSVQRMDDMDGTNLATVPHDVDHTSSPSGIATDSQNRVYIVYPAINQIVRMDANLSLATQVTLGTTGSGAREFNFGSSGGSIALDTNDDIYVADVLNRRIVWTSDMSGVLWDSYPTVNGTGTPVHPLDLWVRGALGPIIYTDDVNEVVQINDITGTGPIRFGTAGTGEGQFGPTLSVAFR